MHIFFMKVSISKSLNCETYWIFNASYNIRSIKISLYYKEINNSDITYVFVTVFQRSGTRKNAGIQLTAKGASGSVLHGYFLTNNVVSANINTPWIYILKSFTRSCFFLSKPRKVNLQDGHYFMKERKGISNKFFHTQQDITDSNQLLWNRLETDGLYWCILNYIKIYSYDLKKIIFQWSPNVLYKFPVMYNALSKDSTSKILLNTS